MLLLSGETGVPTPSTGAVGLGTYVYLERSSRFTVKTQQEKSPLDPDNFVDFKLKKIEPYNHNTAKYVSRLQCHFE